MGAEVWVATIVNYDGGLAITLRPSLGVNGSVALERWVVYSPYSCWRRLGRVAAGRGCVCGRGGCHGGYDDEVLR
jgi:hypothetical protein